MDQKQFENIIEKAKSNKLIIRHLKNAAVHAQEYVFAAELRDIEKEAFPETQEHIDVKKLVKETDLAFRMVQVGVEEIAVYRIIKAYEALKKKKGKFDIKDAAEIIAKSNEIFD